LNEINRLTGKPANHLTTAKANTVLSQSVIKTGFHTHKKGYGFLIFRNFKEGYAKSGKIVSTILALLFWKKFDKFHPRFDL
jgi:hypothetical protein